MQDHQAMPALRQYIRCPVMTRTNCNAPACPSAATHYIEVAGKPSWLCDQHASGVRKPAMTMRGRVTILVQRMPMVGMGGDGSGLIS